MEGNDQIKFHQKSCQANFNPPLGENLSAKNVMKIIKNEYELKALYTVCANSGKLSKICLL